MTSTSPAAGVAVVSSAPPASVTVVSRAWPCEEVEADQPGDEGRPGPAGELCRGADLADPTVLQHDQAVGEGQGVDRVVRHQDRRAVGAPLLGAQQPPDHRPAVLVEGGEGLVQEEDVGVADEGSGDGRSLGLTTRHLAGLRAGDVGHSQPLEPGGGGGSGVVLPDPPAAGAEGDVVAEVQVREQRRPLQHDANRSLVGVDEGALGGIVEDDAVDEKPSFVERGEPRQDPQQRGLA